MKCRFKRIFCAVILAICIVSGFIPAPSATAASKDSSEYKKSLATSLAVCYSTYGVFRSPITTSTYNNYRDYSQMIVQMGAIIKGSKKKPTPAGYGVGTEAKCEYILSAAMLANGLALPWDFNDAGDVLTKLGYVASTTTEGKCFNLQYLVTLDSPGSTASGSSFQQTKSVCVEKVDENDIIQSNKVVIVGNGGDNTVVEFTGGTEKVTIDCWTNFNIGDGGCGSVTYKTGENTFEAFKNTVYNNILKSEKGVSGWHYNIGFRYELDKSYGAKTMPYGAVTAQYTLSNDPVSTALSNLFGFTDLTSSDKGMAFSDQERFVLYQNYLKEFYGAQGIAVLEEPAADDPEYDRKHREVEEQEVLRTGNSSDGGYRKVKVYTGEEFKTCYVKGTANQNKSVTSVGKGGIANMFFGHTARFTDTSGKVTWSDNNETINLTELLDYFETTSVNSLSDELASTISTISCSEDNFTEPPTVPDDPYAVSKPGNEVNAACLQHAAAQQLSWGVCPVINGMAVGSDGLYKTLKDLLVVDSGFIVHKHTVREKNPDTGKEEDVEKDSAAYQIWGFFRDISNIFIIIFVLVVIFSQVSGFGIDNYGIKKILPKVIVAGILINLSYFISQLAVDISNLIGSQLSLFLSSIANTANENAGTDLGLTILGFAGAGTTTLTIVGGALAVEIVPIVTAVIGVAGAATGGAALILVIIVAAIALLVVLISVILFFVLLALQKLLVIVCVVISPLAFVCAMLPNTQNLFKQWLNIFKGVLFLFPICSALYGVGMITKVVVLTANGGEVSFWMAVLAVVAPFLPYLLAPMLLRKSLAAAGDIGAKLQGLGQSAQKGLRSASSAVKDTDTYKDAQRQGLNKFNEFRAKRLKGRLENRYGEIKKAPEYLRRRLGRLQDSIAQTAAANSAEARWANPDMVEAAEEQARKKDVESAIDARKEMFRAMKDELGNEAFKPEDGGYFYQQAIKADADGDEVARDAWIELARENGTAAAKFMKALMDDRRRRIGYSFARRVLHGDGRGIGAFASNGLTRQYFRQIENGKIRSGEEEIGAWLGNMENIKEACSKNINTFEDYTGQSTAVHSFLNGHKADLAAVGKKAVLDDDGNIVYNGDGSVKVDETDVTGAAIVQDLEYFAAEAADRSPDSSKTEFFQAMRTYTDPASGARLLRQTRANEIATERAQLQVQATEDQTRKITDSLTRSASAQLAEATRQTAATESHARTVEDFREQARRQGQADFEARHISAASASFNVQTGEHSHPAGYVPETINGHIYIDPSGTNRRYDAANNRFLP